MSSKAKSKKRPIDLPSKSSVETVDPELYAAATMRAAAELGLEYAEANENALRETRDAERLWAEWKKADSIALSAQLKKQKVESKVKSAAGNKAKPAAADASESASAASASASAASASASAASAAVVKPMNAVALCSAAAAAVAAIGAASMSATSFQFVIQLGNQIDTATKAWRGLTADESKYRTDLLSAMGQVLEHPLNRRLEQSADSAIGEGVEFSFQKRIVDADLRTSRIVFRADEFHRSHRTLERLIDFANAFRKVMDPRMAIEHGMSESECAGKIEPSYFIILATI